MFSLAPAPFRQCSSRAKKVTAASNGLAVTRDPFIIPAHLTKPESWPLPDGSIYEEMANCAMPHC